MHFTGSDHSVEIYVMRQFSSFDLSLFSGVHCKKTGRKNVSTAFFFSYTDMPQSGHNREEQFFFFFFVHLAGVRKRQPFHLALFLFRFSGTSHALFFNFLSFLGVSRLCSLYFSISVQTRRTPRFQNFVNTNFVEKSNKADSNSEVRSSAVVVPIVPSKLVSWSYVS